MQEVTDTKSNHGIFKLFFRERAEKIGVNIAYTVDFNVFQETARTVFRKFVY
jgi:hypothetical protein